ncbi:MAG TPA: hypothetical protein VMD03_04810 [Steroidobacteraceae bacterium]|nr:hypothetical protein [Steroidobacteraceae bacterium]
MLPPHWYPPSRPQSIGEVLDTGFKIFQTTLLPCLPYGVTWVVVGQLATLHDLAAGRPLRAFGGSDPIGWLWFALSIVLALAIWSLLILRQSALASGRTSSLAGELRITLERLPQLVALLLVAAAACAVGLLLLVLPGLYLAVAFTLAVPALLARRLGPIAALRYAARLLYGHFWRTTLILSIALVVTLALYTVVATITLLACTLGGVTDVAVVTAVSRAAGIALGAVAAPFGCAIILAIFGELGARREGPELERRMAAAES